MQDVIIFINKMKVVFNFLPDEEIDIYNVTDSIEDEEINGYSHRPACCSIDDID